MSQPVWAKPLAERLSVEEAGAIARRLTDEQILDVPTVNDIWRLMDTITILDGELARLQAPRSLGDEGNRA